MGQGGRQQLQPLLAKGSIALPTLAAGQEKNRVPFI